jgi:hypothetical protein
MATKTTSFDIPPPIFDDAPPEGATTQGPVGQEIDPPSSPISQFLDIPPPIDDYSTFVGDSTPGKASSIADAHSQPVASPETNQAFNYPLLEDPFRSPKSVRFDIPDEIPPPIDASEPVNAQSLPSASRLMEIEAEGEKFDLNVGLDSDEEESGEEEKVEKEKKTEKGGKRSKSNPRRIDEVCV